MKSLLYLSFLKVKGTVRNQFRTPASALITIFLILLYGGLVIMAFVTSSDNPAAEGTVDTNTAVLIGIGMTAIFAFTVMLNKRKALVYDTDAYYLFAGPYTRKQVNGYILFQSLRQGVLYGLLGCYMIAMFSMAGYFTIPYFLVCFVDLTLMLVFFLLLTDYIYMWGLVNEKYKEGRAHAFVIDERQSINVEKNMLLTVDVFSYGFITLISLIAAANVFNTISTGFLLRRREFAVLSSVGMTPKEMNRMLSYECLLYGLKALLYGIPVSLLVTWEIYRVVQSSMDTSFYVPAASIVIAVFSVFAVVFATMLYARARMKHENIIDSIRQESL